MKLTILGLDPSVSNLGIVKATLSLNNEKKPCGLDLTALELISTSTDAKLKKVVRKNSQDLVRCRELYRGLQEQLVGVDMAFIEMPVGSQTARAMFSYGACVMLAASIGVPLIEVTPLEVKKVTRNPKATKQDMIDWAIAKMPNAPWLERNGKVIKKNEHLADALATIFAGVKSDQFKEAIALSL